MKLMFQMYYDKYIDSHSSLCIGSKSSLAAISEYKNIILLHDGAEHDAARDTDCNVM